MFSDYGKAHSRNAMKGQRDNNPFLIPHIQKDQVDSSRAGERIIVIGSLFRWNGLHMNLIGVFFRTAWGLLKQLVKMPRVEFRDFEKACEADRGALRQLHRARR